MYIKKPYHYSILWIFLIYLYPNSAIQKSAHEENKFNVGVGEIQCFVADLSDLTDPRQVSSE